MIHPQNTKLNSYKSIIGLSKPLPPNHIISTSGTHFYKRGLSLYQFGSAKRNRFFHPLIIFTFLAFMLFRSIFLFFLQTEDPNVIVMVGDYSFFLGNRKHFNAASSHGYLLAILSQIIQFTNYCKNIKPSYLRPFGMMAGFVSPKSIGLTDRLEIYRMIKKTKFLFKFADYNLKAIFILSIIIPLIILSINCTNYYLLIFALLWSFIYAIGIYCIISIFVWQIIYFYIICHYLNLKIIDLNNRVNYLIDNQLKYKFENFLDAYDIIYLEIIEFNETYWSKILLCFVILFLSAINLLIYHSVFGKIITIIKVSYIYGTLFLTIVIINFLNTASSVALTVNKSYGVLNKFMVMNCNRLQINTKIKVKIFLIKTFLRKLLICTL
jgi:hypothetical protein